MDEVTYIKTKYRQEQWEKLIVNCRRSGLKVDEWCEENQVSRHAYYYWLRKIRKKAFNSIVPKAEEQNTSVTFAKVEVPPPCRSDNVEVVIHLPYATIEVLNGSSQQTVESVLLALKNIC